MKKFLISLVLLCIGGGDFVKAQVQPIKTNEILHAASKQSMEIIPQSTNKKKHSVKSAAENTTVICDFSDTSAFTIGTTSYNSVTGDYSGWFHQADTMSTISTCEDGDFINYYFGLANGGYTTFLQDENHADMSAHNGFAYIDMYSSWACDSQNENTLDAYVKLNTPIYTYGMRGVDIYLKQWVLKFNQDRYFIDWSHSEDFSVYDSAEFNYKNVDVASTDNDFGQKIVAIPVGTDNCNVISNDPNEKTYFRIRIRCESSQGLPHGYFWIIDDISWAETPQTRVETVYAKYQSGYHIVPSIVTPENLLMQVAVRNTGASEITNAKAVSKMYYRTYDDDGQSQDDYIGASESEELTIPAGYYNDTLFTGGGNYQINTSNVYYLQTNSSPQLISKGLGTYRATREFAYKTSDGESVSDELASAAWYYVRDSIKGGLYRWAKDVDQTQKTTPAFRSGFINNGYGGVWTTTLAEYNKKGYRVCVEYNASSYQDTVYARGAELVPALDICQAGAQIQASLWYYDTTGVSWDEIVKPVLTDDSTEVKSDIYTLTEDDLNTYDENWEIVSLRPGYELKTIYLPFQSVVLKPDISYFVCYENVTDGEFAVAQDYLYRNIFGANGRNVIVHAPDISTLYQPTWGYMFSYDQCPMIRFMVSDREGGFEPTQPTPEISDVSMGVYDAILTYANILNARSCDKYAIIIREKYSYTTDEYAVDEFRRLDSVWKYERGQEFYTDIEPGYLPSITQWLYGNTDYIIYASVICGGDTMLLSKEFTTPSSPINGTAFTSIEIANVTDNSFAVRFEKNDQTWEYSYAIRDYSYLQSLGITDKASLQTATEQGWATYYNMTTQSYDFFQDAMYNTTETLIPGNTYAVYTASYNYNGELGDVDFKLVTLSSTVEEEDITVCGGYIINGEYITQSGQYEDYENNKVINLTVLPSYDSMAEVTVCAGESYEFAGQTYNTTGVYKDVQTSVEGCDSIITLYLTVLPKIEKNITVAICEGDKYQFGGELLSAEGTYRDTLQSVDGCDSVVNLTLVYLPSYDTVIEATICEGTSYTLNGFNESKEGIYTKKLSSSTCCDSTVTLVLHVSNAITNDIYITVCSGNTYDFYGETLTESGDYTYTVANQDGCDSIYNLHLTVSEPIDTVIYDTIAEGEYIIFGEDTLSQSGTYTKVFLSESNCDSVVTLILYAGDVSLDDVQNADNAFMIYPNPAKEVITLDLGRLASDKNETVSIINNAGQVVYKSDIKSQKFNINVNDFEAGVYYITIGNKTQKLVIE